MNIDSAKEHADQLVELAQEFIEQKYASYTKKEEPFIVGISGPQGSGKSTLVRKLKRKLQKPYRHVVGFSIDDFYLDHKKLCELSAISADNPLLQHRGLPGTHNVRFCSDVLHQLQGQNPVKIPLYDKSAFNGEGDTCPQDQWVQVTPPYHIVLFEGWNVGFVPLDPADFSDICNKATEKMHNPKLNIAVRNLEQINNNLIEYMSLWSQLNSLIYVRTDNIDHIYKWRQQQEDDLEKANKSHMTSIEIVNFVNAYIPAYVLYSDNLAKGYCLTDLEMLLITLNGARQIVNTQIKSV